MRVFLIPTLQRLEESDRRAQHTVEQLQREQRHLRRRLEQLGVERTRMDSTGSTLSSDKSDSDQGEPSNRMILQLSDDVSSINLSFTFLNNQLVVWSLKCQKPKGMCCFVHNSDIQQTVPKG